MINQPDWPDTPGLILKSGNQVENTRFVIRSFSGYIGIRQMKVLTCTALRTQHVPILPH